MEKIKDLKILTGIRFFAAIHVVLFHNLYLLGDSQQIIPKFILSFINKGDSAVSFFFMLSGFILTYAYQNKLKDKNEKVVYLVTRIAKLYPLYILALFLDIPRVAGYFFSKYSISIAATKFFISLSASLLMLQSWIPNLTPVWNSPAWSLSCEMFFYICFIGIVKKLMEAKKKFLIGLACYLTPLILYYAIKNYTQFDFSTPFNSVLWRSLPALRIFEFILGILLFTCTQNNKCMGIIKKNRNIFFWASVGTSVGLTMIDLNFPREIFAQIILLPFFAMIILSSYFDDVRFGTFLRSKHAVILGQASYSIYILHQPIKYYCTLFLSPSILLACLYSFFLIAISVFAHKYLEETMRVRIKQRLLVFWSFSQLKKDKKLING